MESQVIGIVLLVRHGDREGFYQNVADYKAQRAALTPLGSQQQYLLGQHLRNIYLNPSSPSFIRGIERRVANIDQLRVRADWGGEGGVIFSSAVSLLQGLFPPSPAYAITLANGTTIVGPMGGYQAIPIESVEPANDISLEGWTDCTAFAEATQNYYKSETLRSKIAERQEFLSLVPKYLDGRPVNAENIWNVFDFINVHSIHNETFAKGSPPSFLEQIRDLANFHQYGVFSSPELDGIGNIAGQTILPSIIKGFNEIADSASPLRVVYQAISYKPFISLFNMTGAAQMNPELVGIVNYAAAISFEVRRGGARDEPVIRFNFKNGTDDAFHTYKFMNSSSDIPISTFAKYFEHVAFDDLPNWCRKCNNLQDRGCAALGQSPAGTPGSIKRPAISPTEAGLLGAGATIAVFTTALMTAFFLRLVTFGRRKIESEFKLKDFYAASEKTEA